MNLRMYRTATHPEYVEHEIKPAVERYGLPEACALSVAQLMDATGRTVDEACAAFVEILGAFSGSGETE